MQTLPGQARYTAAPVRDKIKMRPGLVEELTTAQEEHPDEKKWAWHEMEPDFKPLVNIASVVRVVPAMNKRN